MYAVGHFALGYLSGKTISHFLKVKINIPLLFLISIITDVDILIPALQHRGPLHSLVFYCGIFIPVYLLFGKRSIPYFVALIQHSLVGDYITGGTQLFWPVNTSFYGLDIEVANLTNIILEWLLFITSMAFMVKTKDVWLLFQHNSSNIILSVPLLALLLPATLRFPIDVPVELLFPHVIYIGLFSLYILNYLKKSSKN